MKKFGLNAKSAEECLNLLESMSIKDLEEFVQTNAEVLPNLTQEKRSLAKYSGVLLNLIKNNVIGAENRSASSARVARLTRSRNKNAQIHICH